MSSIKQATFTGTGAAINISVGFQPDYVLIVNLTDGDERWEWHNGMTAAHAIKIAADGTQSRITSNGISQYTGSATAAEGFTAGSACSESAKVFSYLAIRETA